ncbi:sigma-54 interaction domain-containing protein [Virgibacillus alimentarius]|uniref:HTH-type transcriptional regulatory protein TyrR n=1 Tax=Virgibacillus alimentarius TaxID=698769 RepID=A0ABS4SAV5_9BACI|nr:sigma 54-interacting transcriptional regulator [Virgibacillus alimentarius]MBP2258140.1 PAS domain S-box-containing protein [Virgibacillus alimentarius]
MNKEPEMLQLELEGIMHASNDNIVMTDGEGKVIRVSSNCTSIYGKEEDELVGKTVFELEKDRTFSPSVTAVVLNEKKEVQVMQRTPTGKVVMATGIPLFNKKRDIVRIISFSHDLTEIQLLKEDYEELRAKMIRYESEIEELREQEKRTNVIIKSKTMIQIRELVERVAKSDANVVLLGESGVGKNVFAKALHEESERNQKKVIEVNCGAIPEPLFESELFGYEPGSFTGASKSGKKGMIELADQGTLFLDEIAELPLSIQVKLLKVLQEKKVTPIGGSEAKQVDFRLITATNQDLEVLVKQGKFREDLFYRLNVIPITIPPLRERKDDIYKLAQHYLTIFNEKYHTNKFFHSKAMNAMQQYDWPGNVRELENLIERLVVTTDTNMIFASNLPFVNQMDASELPKQEWQLESFEEQGLTLQEVLEAVERNWLIRASKQYKTTYEMAEYLGLSQSTVVRRLKKYNINSK